MEGVAVAVVGPPHSGKSVFLAALYKRLQGKGMSFFLQRAAPDGEGMWSAETDIEAVREVRRKGAFTPEFVKAQVSGIERLKGLFDLVLVDTGGKRSPENKEILKVVDYGITIVGDQYGEGERAAWESFLKSAGVKILGSLRSTVDPEAKSEIRCSGTSVEGTLAGLERGKPLDSYARSIDEIIACMQKLV